MEIPCASCGKKEREHSHDKNRYLVEHGVVFSTECLIEWERENPPTLVVNVKCNPA